MASDGQPPDLLLVLKLDAFRLHGDLQGHFPVDLWAAKRASKRRVRSLRLRELAALNPRLLIQEHPLAELNRLFSAAELPEAR